jgi:hypothetical protein
MKVGIMVRSWKKDRSPHDGELGTGSFPTDNKLRFHITMQTSPIPQLHRGHFPPVNEADFPIREFINFSG